jgi:hypothetical protein
MVACGSPATVVVPEPQPPLEPTSRELLQAELSRIEPLLLTCNGGPTDNKSSNVSGIPQCDSGDSILPVGLLSTVATPEELHNYGEFIANSIAENGRPFRSPDHLYTFNKRLAEGGDTSDSNFNFSRDHLLGIILYSMSSKDCSSLSKVYNYAASFQGKFCPGGYAQCSISLPILNLIGDAYGICGLTKTKAMEFSDNISAVAELLAITTAEPGYQMELAVNYVYAKHKAGTLITTAIPIVEKAVERSPNNEYFRYVLNLVTVNNEVSNEQIGQSLLIRLQRWQGPGTVWIWQWIEEPQNTNGWDLYFLAKLLLK